MSVVNQQILSRSAEETRNVGRRLARRLSGGLVLLRGPLGAGKSELVRGMAEELGARSWRGSPTFTLVNEYDTQPPLYHADLYRLEELEVEELGLEEYVRPGTLLVVEWSDRAPAYLASLSETVPVSIELSLLGPEERLLSVVGVPVRDLVDRGEVKNDSGA